jgi:serine/threonine protein kinase/tetratricopeptide (TPR) repeat protein
VSESQVFADALKLPTPAERAAYLDRACAGDPGLRAGVEALLRAHASDPGFLEPPAGSLAGTTDPPAATGPAATTSQPVAAERPGAVLAGRYKLLEPIGEGGMGEVWMAQQTEPVRRLVAVKLIKPGLDSKQVLARFEAERQALALMDHPNIAKVLDGGAAPDGRPFFVMELVRGVPITRFCDEHRLTPRQRLELLVPVCRAVQHAHQKGVIHRDLKPSNVLVGDADGRPAPKVIDFGVAKAAGQPLTDQTLHTGFGAVVGTVEYMSPEQATFNQLDIDTRSDVYSLGVLLYELLAGSPPFTRKELEKLGMLEMLRVIREQEPSKPSAKLSTAEGLPALAANRGMDPGRLTRLVRGELDWIVMKALEKDRSRRYETANGFATDLGRYLADEPVQAGPPSRWYRLRKFVRRNRGQVTAVAGMFLLLVGGTVGTTAGMFEARHHARLASAREEAEARERQRATDAEGEAKTKEKEARDQLALTIAVTEFLLHELLGQASTTAQADRGFRPDPNLTVRTALDRAAATVGSKFQDEPVMEAIIRLTLGDAYRELGQYDQAIAHLRRSADIRLRELGPDNDHTLRALHHLALTYREARRTAEAIELSVQVRDAQMRRHGPDDEDTLTTLSNLAAAYRDAGNLPEAIRLSEQVRDARMRTLGPDAPSTLTTLNNLAVLYLEVMRTTEAIRMLEQVRDAKARRFSPDHPAVLDTLVNLGGVYWQTNQLDKSIPIYEAVLAARRRTLVEGHPDLLRAMANLGVNYRDVGRVADALPLLEQAHRGGRGQAALAWVAAELIIAYQRAGMFAEAAPPAREALAAARKTLPAHSPKLAAALAQCGSVALHLREWAEAEALLRECLAIRRANNPDSWTTFNAQSLLGGALLGQQKYAEAEPLLVQGYTGLKKHETTIPGSARGNLVEALQRLVQLYDAWDKPAEAAKWRTELEKRNK